MKKCPFCAELVQDEAIVCRYCGRGLKVSAAEGGIGFEIGRIFGRMLDPLGYIYIAVVFALYLVVHGTTGMVLFAIINAGAIAIGVLVVRKTRKRKLGFAIIVVSALCVLIGIFSAVGNYQAEQDQQRQNAAARVKRQLQAEMAEKQRQAAKLEEEARIEDIRAHKPQIYQDAVVLLKAGKYDQALDLFKKIALVDPNYEELPTKTKMAEDALQKAREKEKRETKAKVERTAAEAKAKEKRLSRAQNRDGLTAKVSLNKAQFFITNESEQPWTQVKLEINGGIFSGGYIFKTALIKSKTTYTVEIMEFVNSDGERFNPFQKKVQNLMINASLPDGRLEFWHGGWE